MYNRRRIFRIDVRWNSKALLFLLLAQLACVLEVSAQEVVPLPTVTRAIDVFVSNPEHFVVGSRLQFEIKDAQAAQRIVSSGLQVRVFALRESQFQPSPITTIDDCDVFISIVLPIQRHSDTEAVIQELDYTWLNLSYSRNSIKPGRYFLVFEQYGPDSKEFRLKTSDYKSYFGTGFLLIVDPNEGISIEKVRKAYSKRIDQLRDLRLVIDERKSSVPCYTYRKLADETPLDMQISQNTMAYCEGQLEVEAVR